MRTIGILLLLAGFIGLGYGIWQFYEDKQQFETAEIRTTVEDGDTPLAVWIGGAMIIVGGVAVFASGNRRRG